MTLTGRIFATMSDQPESERDNETQEPGPDEVKGGIPFCHHSRPEGMSQEAWRELRRIEKKAFKMRKRGIMIHVSSDRKREIPKNQRTYRKP